MIRPALVQARLEDLYLCPDLECRTVSNDSNRCPRCLSREVSNLATIVNGRPAEPVTSQFKTVAPEAPHARTH